MLGVVAGVSAAALNALLNLAQRIGYGDHGHTFLQAARAAPAWRHFAALLGAAVIVIVGLRVLGRLPASGGTEVSEATVAAVGSARRSGRASRAACCRS